MIVDNGKYYLYRHIRLDTNEPFYIGIGSKGLKWSYHRAFDKGSRNIYWKRIVNKIEYEVQILLESNDYEFIKQKEIEFISLYKRKINKGVLCNLTKGGDGTKGHIAKKGNESHHAKKVLQYDKEGNFINIFYSLVEASKKTNIKAGLIAGCINNIKLEKAGNFRWFHYYENYALKIDPLPISRKSLIIQRNDKVYQYNLEGNFIREWDSIKEISIILNIRYDLIKRCIYNKSYNSFTGFLWRFKSQNEGDKLKKHVCKFKKIEQYDKGLNFIKEWESVTEIIKELGFNFNQVSSCCRNEQKTCKGFIWKYKI